MPSCEAKGSPASSLESVLISDVAKKPYLGAQAVGRLGVLRPSQLWHCQLFSTHISLGLLRPLLGSGQ